MQLFDPIKWYWIINGTTIYSSESASVIDSTDINYSKWKSAGNAATPIPSSNDLDQILQKYGLPVTGLTPPTTAQLIGYTNTKTNTIISTVKNYGTSPKILKADRSSSTLTDLIAIQQDAVTNPTDPVIWLANDNTVTNFIASEIATLAPMVAADRKAIFSIAASAVTAINATTITTYAEIDALTWPS